MITAAIEPYPDVIDTLKPMFPLHWEEVGIYKDKMPLNPRYHEYAQDHAAGRLIMPVARHNGKIIGYWPHFIAPNKHYDVLTATMDILYVDPHYRHTGAASMMFETVRRELKRRGVKLWWAGSKNHKEIEGFLRLMGFEPQETYFSMWLGD